MAALRRFSTLAIYAGYLCGNMVYLLRDAPSALKWLKDAFIQFAIQITEVKHDSTENYSCIPIELFRNKENNCLTFTLKLSDEFTPFNEVRLFCSRNWTLSSCEVTLAEWGCHFRRNCTNCQIVFISQWLYPYHRTQLSLTDDDLLGLQVRCRQE